MKTKFILLTLIFSTFLTQPALSKTAEPELQADPGQALLYNQLLNDMKNKDPKEFEKASQDPDLQTLMQVMEMVQNNGYKEAVPVLENLLKNPKGKALTPQSKKMIQNLLDVMKAMDSGMFDEFNKP